MEIIVLSPSGFLITSGCGLYLYARFKYERLTPMFDNFATLKDYLRSNPSLQSKSCVVVEGTLTQEKNATSNTEKVSTHSLEKDKPSSLSTDFCFLSDSNGVCIRVKSTKAFARLVAKRKGEQPHVHDSEDHLGILGYALIDGQEVCLTPLQYDKTMSAILARRKTRKRLLYAGSCLLILSGCVVLNAVVTFVLPAIRAYKIFQ